MERMKDNYTLLNYISYLRLNEIKTLLNFSEIYSSIIDLHKNYDESEDIFKRVYNIIKDADCIILKDSENFVFNKLDNNQKQIKQNISLKELIELKNRIFLSENQTKIDFNSNELLKIKCNILINFKKIISNVETIIEYMNHLRKKGNVLDIKICIKINIQNNQLSIIYNLIPKKNLLKRL